MNSIPSDEQIAKHFDIYSDQREYWLKKSNYFHSEDLLMLNELLTSNSSVLEIGCGTGNLIGRLEIKNGYGIDISEKSIKIAKKKYKKINFLCGDILAFKKKINRRFDFIIISDTIGYFQDIQKTLKNLHYFCSPFTRIILSYYSPIWQPLIKLAEVLKLKMPDLNPPMFSTGDLENFLKISNFETIKFEKKIISPYKFVFLGRFINKFVANLPLINHFCLRQYIVSRSLKKKNRNLNSTSIIIPCKNESGNIENCIKRIPKFCKKMEIIFVEGNSSDDTWDKILLTSKMNNPLNDGFKIRVFKQSGVGKKDAVFKGFDEAKNDILMILDCDLTVSPEELYKFWEKISSGEAEFVNGTRLVYPLEKESMQFLNYLANKIFSHLFTWVFGQKITDTLCGTKVISKRHFTIAKRLNKNFKNLDPFGDFFFILSSFKLNLKMIEIPIRYKERVFGVTQISRFTDGFKLLKMFFKVLTKFKMF